MEQTVDYCIEKKRGAKKNKAVIRFKKDCKDGYSSIGNMEPGDVEKFLFAVLNFK